MGGKKVATQVIYIARHRDGYCLTHDSRERPGGYVKTLCSYCITMPTRLDEYTEDLELDSGFKLCGSCERLLGS
jgi:hypothetical protein